jgi:WD40 repeat protein
LWDVGTGEERLPTRGHGGGITSVDISPDGRILASASEDTFAKLWDLATGREQRTLTGHPNVVRFVRFTPDGRTLATGSWIG